MHTLSRRCTACVPVGGIYGVKRGAEGNKLMYDIVVFEGMTRSLASSSRRLTFRRNGRLGLGLIPKKRTVTHERDGRHAAMLTVVVRAD